MDIFSYPDEEDAADEVPLKPMTSKGDYSPLNAVLLDDAASGGAQKSEYEVGRSGDRARAAKLLVRFLFALLLVSRLRRSESGL